MLCKLHVTDQQMAFQNLLTVKTTVALPPPQLLIKPKLQGLQYMSNQQSFLSWQALFTIISFYLKMQIGRLKSLKLIILLPYLYKNSPHANLQFLIN